MTLLSGVNCTYLNKQNRILGIDCDKLVGMKYSKSSWYTRTDPMRDKTRSRLHHEDTKKRRVSFLPSLEIQEYAQKDPYMVPLEDHDASPVQIQWKYNENLLVSSSAPPPTFSLLNTGTSSSPTDSGANSKHPANETYSFEDSNSEDLRNSSLEIPDYVKEQLVDIVKRGIVRSENNNTIITEYAPLITPKKLTPIKKKFDFPPNSLDPLHPKLKFRRKRKDETNEVVKISIDNNDAIIPIALIKKVLSKHTNYAFIPANLSIWIQDHTTKVFEHLSKLLYEQSRKDRRGFALATPQDVCAVMKEYLGLDDSVNIPNLISSHLPMELWFEYNENP